MGFPALSENRPLRLAAVTGMYVVQGIQFGRMNVALPAYLAASGVSAAAVGGFVGAVFFPWGLKLLFAPLVERYNFLPMGRRRPWVLIGILGGAAGYVAMSLVTDPIDHLGMLTAAAVAGSSFIALLDVSVDAMTIDIVPLDEQPQANALMWGGKVLGAAGTSAGAPWLFGIAGLSATFGVVAILTAICALIPLLLRERPGERLLPWTKGAASEEARQVQLRRWIDIWRSLRRVLFLPASLKVGLVVFIYGLSFGLFDALMPVLTVQELSWTDAAYSRMVALGAVAGGLFGMALGGWMVRQIGRIRSVQASLLVLAVLGISMWLAAPFWMAGTVVEGFIVLAHLARPMVSIAAFAVCMALCWKSVSAVQFTVYTSLNNFGLAGGAALLGLVNAVLSYPQVFLVFAGLALAGLLLLGWVRLESHLARMRAIDAATPSNGAIPEVASVS